MAGCPAAALAASPRPPKIEVAFLELPATTKKMSTATPVLISIEGNIGSGKSTLMRELRKRNPSWHFIDEPVESWMGMRDDSGKSLLELFYEDKQRWAYTFQNTALITRILNAKAAIRDWEAAGRPGKPIFITERCIHTDANVFARMLRADGDINNLEWTLYKKWFDGFASQVPDPLGYIHVDTPVTVCSERINGRAREGEGGIPVKYLDELDSAHFSWLRRDGFDTPVMRVDNVTAAPTPVEEVERFVERQWLGAVD
jgi:deoxyadenosine/deoxycytidine kinase